MKIKLILLLAISSIAAGTSFGQDLARSITDLGKMAGCWERENKAASLYVNEQWMIPAGNTMIGMGRTVKNGITTEYEYMRIEQRGIDLFFISKPKANPSETEFKLTSMQPGLFVFENPTHDFPQKIIYRLTDAKRLDARIEGTINGKQTKIDFPFVRGTCN